jgi:hypothetical protein
MTDNNRCVMLRSQTQAILAQHLAKRYPCFATVDFRYAGRLRLRVTYRFTSLSTGTSNASNFRMNFANYRKKLQHFSAPDYRYIIPVVAIPPYNMAHVDGSYTDAFLKPSRCSHYWRLHRSEKTGLWSFQESEDSF